MLTTKGIAGSTSNLTRRRQQRYYKLLVLAAKEIENRKRLDAHYRQPLLLSVEQYMTQHECLDGEVLQKIWLTQTEVCSRLAESHMSSSKCAKVIRIDYSQKLCSKLKVFGPDGSKEQAAGVRMLLLVQNEIGQVMARGLTKSENHEETALILRSVAEKHRNQTDVERFCVCDHANGMRNLVHDIFGDALAVKQDPFHVIQRMTKTIRDSAKRQWLSKRLSEALYDVERNLRPPEEMATLFSAALSSMKTCDIRVSIGEWEGSVQSNLEQIRKGDLFVEASNYQEGGGTVRVVSTSQLEAIHSKLRKPLDRVVSVEVGMRILDIFILQHNLKVGARFRRNPEFEGYDFITLCRSALVCRGIIPDSPQLEFINQLLDSSSSAASLQARYRPGGQQGHIHRPWETIYDMIPLHVDRAEATMLRNDSAHDDIRKLLNAVNQGRKQLSQRDFVENLGLEPEYESTSEFSAHEFSLLKQLRADQLASKEKKWESCDVVATILYNAAVRQLDNPILEIRTHGYHAIARRVSSIDDQLKQSSKSRPTKVSGIIAVINKKIDDENNLAVENALQEKLFQILRLATGIKNVKQVYRSVYDFAACTCPGINRKSDTFLERRWDSLRRAQNYSRVKYSEKKVVKPSQSDTVSVECAPARAQPIPSSNVFGVPEMDSGYDKNPPPTKPVPVQTFKHKPISRTKAPLEILSQETKAALIAYTAGIPKGTHGKWASIHALYLQMNPTGKLSRNALCCRLKERKAKQKISQQANRAITLESTSSFAPQQFSMNTKPVPESANTESDSTQQTQQETLKADSGPACNSYRSRKRGCHPNSTNPDCEKRKKAKTQSIADFLVRS